MIWVRVKGVEIGCENLGDLDGVIRRYAAPGVELKAEGVGFAKGQRMHMACDCGCTELLPFGPYNDGDDSYSDPFPGLRWIFTCSKCGEQLRLYQTSDRWRELRGVPDPAWSPEKKPQ